MVNFSPPPKKAASNEKKSASEKAIAQVINKGGKPTKTENAKDSFKNFNIKLLESEIDTINELRELRPRNRNGKRLGISLHDWLIEAVQEKIKRDTR